MYLYILSWVVALICQGMCAPTMSSPPVEHVNGPIPPPLQPKESVVPVTPIKTNISKAVPLDPKTFAPVAALGPPVEPLNTAKLEKTPVAVQNPLTTPKTTSTTTTTKEAVVGNPKVVLPKVETEKAVPPVKTSRTSSTSTTTKPKEKPVDAFSIDESIPDPAVMSKVPVESDNVYLMSPEKHGVMKDDVSSHFFAYLLTFMVLIILCYLVFHNKQKILGLILEGRSETTRRQRGRAKYHKLDNNLEEAMSSTKGGTSLVY